MQVWHEVLLYLPYHSLAQAFATPSSVHLSSLFSPEIHFLATLEWDMKINLQKASTLVGPTAIEKFEVVKRVQYPLSKAVAIRSLTPSCSDVDIACWRLFKTFSLLLLLYFCLVLFFHPTIVLSLFLASSFCCSILQ